MFSVILSKFLAVLFAAHDLHLQSLRPNLARLLLIPHIWKP